ncbi:MAG TPA: hypothetical protein VGK41_05620 [Solirubrobacterales bacterium]
MYRTTDPATTAAPRVARTFHQVQRVVMLALVLLVAISSAAAADASAPNVAAVRAATTPVDTGQRAEDQQPAFTERLAAAGWDYNPGCEQGGRFDWFPIGHPCHTGHVVYPSGATVPAS